MGQEYLITNIQQQSMAKLNSQHQQIVNALNSCNTEIINIKEDLKLQKKECDRKASLFKKKEDYDEEANVFFRIVAALALFTIITTLAVRFGNYAEFHEIISLLKFANTFTGLSTLAFVVSGVVKSVKSKLIKVKQSDIDADQALIDSKTTELNNSIAYRKGLEMVLKEKEADIRNMSEVFLNIYSALANHQVSNNVPVMQQSVPVDQNPYANGTQPFSQRRGPITGLQQDGDQGVAYQPRPLGN